VLSALINSRNIRNDLNEKNQENDAFDRMSDDMAGRIHYMNVLTDSGTVLRFNVLHFLLGNPNYPETIVSLDTYENRNSTTVTMMSSIKM
jgi:hypothetical protein